MLQGGDCHSVKNPIRGDADVLSNPRSRDHMVTAGVHKSGNVVVPNSRAHHAHKDDGPQERLSQELAALSPEFFLVVKDPRKRVRGHERRLGALAEPNQL